MIVQELLPTVIDIGITGARNPFALHLHPPNQQPLSPDLFEAPLPLSSARQELDRLSAVDGLFHVAWPNVQVVALRYLSGKKSTRGAGLSTDCILQHEGDQWVNIRRMSVIDTNVCMGIQESLLRVTSFKAAKQFIGNKQKGWMSSCLGFLRHSKTFYPIA